jgi:hypothetical protein
MRKSSFTRMIEAKEVQMVTRSAVTLRKPYTDNIKNKKGFVNFSKNKNRSNPIRSKPGIKKSMVMESQRSSLSNRNFGQMSLKFLKRRLKENIAYT